MSTGLVWFRRDLRVTDHAALSRALSKHARVHCVFVLDSDLLDRLPRSATRRVEFLLASLVELDQRLRDSGGGLLTERGRPEEVIAAIAKSLAVDAVYANRDYSPFAVRRDERVRESLQQQGIALMLSKDLVIFERSEVLTKSGGPFAVFTPYKNAWLAKLGAPDLEAHPVRLRSDRLVRPPPASLPTLDELGFGPAQLKTIGIQPGESGAHARFSDFKRRVDAYDQRRDFPSIKGPSYLSVHLRFGTISIRSLARFARERGGAGADIWLAELIWREFYFMILAHHPRVAHSSYRPEYDRLEWDDDAPRFEAWCDGRTGYPIVDAALRQMNRTGYMHNRLRMIAASFLTKDLHVDWRRGERYFAAQLIDYDLAANNGGWQWAASTGCDAQPYFRIFNPVSQSERFDADGAFIHRYVPELKTVPTKYVHAPWQMPIDLQTRIGCLIGRDYPAPIVDHAHERGVALERYQRAVSRPRSP